MGLYKLFNAYYTIIFIIWIRCLGCVIGVKLKEFNTRVTSGVWDDPIFNKT